MRFEAAGGTILILTGGGGQGCKHALGSTNRLLCPCQGLAVRSKSHCIQAIVHIDGCPCHR